jgi:peptidyl-prolyl cis-trans isomerase B (cyclophilin B)
MRMTLMSLLVSSFLIMTGCGVSNTADDTKISNTPVPTQAAEENKLKEDDKVDQNPIVTIEMENGGIIKAELYPKVAPNTVRNFISLINKGFYDGLIFHRVIPGFVIQGGDPNGTGTGGPGYSIKGEFSSNGFKNDLKHSRGVLSMARSAMPDSAGSQFFIMVADSPHLDGQYAAFGKVIEGMAVVDEIVNVETNANDKPLKDQKMKKVTVETFGVTYEEPETLNKK